jgi:hypothetical protein
MERLVEIVKEVEKQLRWKRNHTVTVSFYITNEEEVILSRVYRITREPMDYITFERRKGYRAFIRNNEVLVRRENGNKKGKH